MISAADGVLTSHRYLAIIERPTSIHGGLEPLLEGYRRQTAGFRRIAANLGDLLLDPHHRPSFHTVWVVCVKVHATTENRHFHIHKTPSQNPDGFARRSSLCLKWVNPGKTAFPNATPEAGGTYDILRRFRTCFRWTSIAGGIFPVGRTWPLRRLVAINGHSACLSVAISRCEGRVTDSRSCRKP